jgi:hypothetical protein
MTRKVLLARITKTGAMLRTLAGKTVEVTWSLAEDLVLLQGTFPQGKDGAAAFVASASTASGKGEATIRNLVRAVEVRNALTTAQREKVQDWSYDMVLSLADGKLTGSQKTALIGKVEKSATRSPIEVRKIKRDMVGGAKRNRKTSADATVALAAKVQTDVQKLIDHGHNPVALAAGAQLAREYTGDVAAAILFVAAQLAKTAEKVAA